MSGFDKDWLALREPADMAARDPVLIGMLAGRLHEAEDPAILDIGCGTGSTWRSLNEHLPAGTRWLLLDHDPLLLDEAQRRIGADGNVGYRQFDLTDLDGLPLEGISVVTASALFDLVSDDFCAAFVERLAGHRCGLYAALNYDGVVYWSYAHPLDADMIAAFNRHQQTDKGFGPALGPGATACLEKHLGASGYAAFTRPSPWRMDASSAALQEAFLLGFHQPLVEMSGMSTDEIEDWLSFRIEAIGRPGSLCEVGHFDLIAFPG
jgi:SAM-dependent methyltransferase